MRTVWGKYHLYQDLFSPYGKSFCSTWYGHRKLWIPFIWSGFCKRSHIHLPLHVSQSILELCFFNARSFGAFSQQVIKEENLQENSHEVGIYMLLKFAKLRDEFEIIGDVRGKGLMIGIEMVKDKVGSDLLLSLWLFGAARSKVGSIAQSFILRERARRTARALSMNKMLEGRQEF